MEDPPPSECALAVGSAMEERLFAMVSEWMVNGNIVEFVEAHRDANRFELVGLTPTTDSTNC